VAKETIALAYGLAFVAAAGAGLLAHLIYASVGISGNALLVITVGVSMFTAFGMSMLIPARETVR